MVIGAAAMVAQNVQASGAAKDAQKGEDRNFINQSKAKNLEADQKQKEAIDTKTIRAREAAIEEGRLNVIQGESGLSGLSFEKTGDETQFNKGTDIASIESNRLAAQRQLAYESESLAIASRNRRNKIVKPDWIGGTLGVVAAGASAYKPSGGGSPTSGKTSSGGFNKLRNTNSRGSNKNTTIPSGKS